MFFADVSAIFDDGANNLSDERFSLFVERPIPFHYFKKLLGVDNVAGFGMTVRDKNFVDRIGEIFQIVFRKEHERSINRFARKLALFCYAVGDDKPVTVHKPLILVVLEYPYRATFYHETFFLTVENEPEIGRFGHERNALIHNAHIPVRIEKILMKPGTVEVIHG